MREVTPLWKRRPPPRPDPLTELRALVEEYTAAGSRERNYGSSRFAHLFWSYLTDLAPLLQQRQADRSAELEAAVERSIAAVHGRPPPRPSLHVVK